MTDLASELAAALRELASTDFVERVSAVEQLAHVSNKIVDKVLEELARPGSARYLIFERLGRFGSLIVEPLEQLLVRSDDHELRVLTAVALLSLGSRAGLEVVLDAVRADDPLVCVAARVLADTGVDEAQPRIEEAVYQCEISNTAVIECLVAALHQFNDHLSEGIIARLQLVEPVWLRESLLH
jgi:hypothetical protein